MWEKVAEGDSFDTLNPLVSDRELRKGQRVQIRMQTSLPGASAGFDVCPNWGFPAPEGMEVIDVWGEGGLLGKDGVVELEADPAWLWAIIAFMRSHWVAVVIAGTALYLIVRFLEVFVQVVPPVLSFLPWLIAGGLAVAGVLAIARFLPRPAERGNK